MADMIEIAVHSLTPEAFAAFGEVLEHSVEQRLQDFPAAFEADEYGSNASLAIIRVREASLYPITIDRLERHPHSAQTFIPLRDARFLVAVCRSKADGSPDLATLQAFETMPGQTVTFGRNVWHKGITALNDDAFFVMTMLKTKEMADTDFAAVEPTIQVRR